MPRVSVVIPTCGDRPLMLARVQQAIADELGESVEQLVIHGHSWGGGINAGLDQAAGDMIVTACDDTLPHRGWLTAALDVFNAGFMPHARFVNTAGEPLTVHDTLPAGQPVHWTRLFVLDRQLHQRVGPLLETTWYTDNDYSRRLIQAGVPIVSCPGFSFTHLDGPRTWQRAGVLERERALYLG